MFFCRSGNTGPQYFDSHPSSTKLDLDLLQYADIKKRAKRVKKAKMQERVQRLINAQIKILDKGGHQSALIGVSTIDSNHGSIAYTLCRMWIYLMICSKKKRAVGKGPFLKSKRSLAIRTFLRYVRCQTSTTLAKSTRCPNARPVVWCCTSIWRVIGWEADFNTFYDKQNSRFSN